MDKKVKEFAYLGYEMGWTGLMSGFESNMGKRRLTFFKRDFINSYSPWQF